jgi:hypothetical protein
LTNSYFSEGLKRVKTTNQLRDGNLLELFQEVRQSRGEEVLVYLVGTKVRDWRILRKVLGVVGRKLYGKTMGRPSENVEKKRWRNG